MTFDRSDSAGYMTNWAARLFARAIDRKLKPLGMSSGQLPVFFALGNGGAMSQKALTKAAAIEQPTMAATLSRMEKHGLIERCPDPRDGRSALISLTPAAVGKTQAVAAAISDINARALANLPEEERTRFLSALKSVVFSLEPDAAER